MISELCILLMTFRGAFTREATFQWFAVAVFGFIVRLDHHGVSSSIRWLRLLPSCYESFLAFFRASAALYPQNVHNKISRPSGRTLHT